ncbi:MAG: phosphohydrolase [Microbacteriaceae bacterium]|nr:phosphohydrolase [Microbacteriaceae bacterium]
MAETERLLQAWAECSRDENEAWQSAIEGPATIDLAARLSTVPQPFLDPRVSVVALSGDILGPGELVCAPYCDDPRVRCGAAIGLWLCASEEILSPFSPTLAQGDRFAAIDALALRLAPVSNPETWSWDDERREEAVRTFLLWSGFLPAGEDRDTAHALLAARDSLSRQKALAEAFEEHRHRAEIARRLADARAKEAAARYSSE